MGYFLWYDDDDDDGTVQNIDDSGGGTYTIVNMDCHFRWERFKFSWKIRNALLMMMMQRLNHRLRHVKLMNDSLCQILVKGGL